MLNLGFVVDVEVRLMESITLWFLLFLLLLLLSLVVFVVLDTKLIKILLIRGDAVAACLATASTLTWHVSNRNFILE